LNDGEPYHFEKLSHFTRKQINYLREHDSSTKMY
jgi:hypothetical protein